MPDGRHLAVDSILNYKEKIIQKKAYMIEDAPDILIVDAKKYDIELMLEALNKHKL